MSFCITLTQPIAPRVPYSLCNTLITLLKHLIPVPLSGLANRQESPALSIFQVHSPRVPETISAKTVKEVTEAYERKSLHLLLLRAQAIKRSLEKLGF
jgi:hypothetical protein